MKEYLKKKLFEMADSYIDTELGGIGFSRRKKSLIYLRKIDNAKQKIDLNLESYYSGYFYIYPLYSVCFPELIEQAKLMTVEDSLFNRIINNKTEFVIKEPVQLISKTEMWMLDENTEIEELSLKICGYFRDYLFPLMSDLSSIKGFIDMYEKGDSRIKFDDTKCIYIASAYILNGEYDKALRVLEKRYKAAGHRMHASIFQYLKELN